MTSLLPCWLLPLALLLVCWVAPCQGSLSVAMYANNSCTAPLSSPTFPSISQPSLALGYNTIVNLTCLAGSGVSGRPGVQWLAYWCPANQTGFYSGLYLYEFDYSLPDGSCPFVDTNSGNQNWSVVAVLPIDDTPTCYTTLTSVFNATRGRSLPTIAYSSFSCGPNVLPNHAMRHTPTARSTAALFFLSSLLLAIVSQL